MIGGMMNDAILPPMASDKRLQEDWVRDASPRVLINLRIDFRPMD